MRVLVSYGTQTGNSRGIAQQIGETLTEHGFDAPVACVDQFKKLKFEQQDLLVVVISTTGNGDAPENAETFVRYLKKKTQPTDLFAKVRYAVLGIGDTNYDNYQLIPKVVDRNLKRLGAHQFYPRGEADEECGLETVVEPWIEGLLKVLLEMRDSASGLKDPAAAAAGDASSPAVPLSNGASQVKDGAAKEGADPALANGEAEATNSAATEVEGVDEEEDGAAAEEWAKLPGGSAHTAHAARVIEAEWLTLDQDDRKVMTLSMDVSECDGPALAAYDAGDAVAVLPTNPCEEVRACLRLLGIDAASAAEPLAYTAKGLDVPGHLKSLGDEPLTVRRAFEERVDLGASAGWPRPQLLKTLADHAMGEDEARLRAMASDRTAVAAERPSLSELLEAFPSARPPVMRLLDALPPLAERYYSLASSAKEHPGRMRICFSVVSYRTKTADGGSRVRKGLCSSMLADKGEELVASGGWVKTTVRIYRRRPTGNELRLPKSLATPIIMVGPGTGVAPFISFLYERRAAAKAQGAGAAARLGPAHLFFGCQHRVGDFLFDKELVRLQEDGSLTQLHTAFSRDAMDTAASGEWRNVRLNVNYVQDLFYMSAPEIARLITKEGAHLYICGDGRAMAADVHRELVATLQNECGFASAVEADTLLSGLATEGRYTREIWY